MRHDWPRTDFRDADYLALLLTAGRALLSVQRLDQTALPRVLATVTAAVSAAAAERERRWRTAPGQLNSRGEIVFHVGAQTLAVHALTEALAALVAVADLFWEQRPHG